MIGTGVAVAKGESGVAKCFVFKTLTSNPLRLRILQTHFAKPAPVAGLREMGGVGY
jgi:hypothetical protein